MHAEHGNYECYFNDATHPTGLYRCGTKFGSVVYLESLWFVIGKDYVGCHRESLQLSLEQWHLFVRCWEGPRMNALDD